MTLPIRLEQRPDGLVRITLKKPYSDGTVAVDMDPLSLLTRLATSVPPHRFHTVRYAGVLAAASCLWRPFITPEPPGAATEEPGGKGTGGGYRPWAELLARSFVFYPVAAGESGRAFANRRRPISEEFELEILSGAEYEELIGRARLRAFAFIGFGLLGVTTVVVVDRRRDPASPFLSKERLGHSHIRPAVSIAFSAPRQHRHRA